MPFFWHGAFIGVYLNQMIEKVNKNCCVRLPESLHKAAKIQAYKEGINLQTWISDLIEIKLKSRESNSVWLCQQCGKWELMGTQLAKLGNCQNCLKLEVPIFPCWEKS